MRRNDVDDPEFENSGCGPAVGLVIPAANSPILACTKVHKITLPFPPSVNSLYGGGSGQKRFPSKKYKEWLKRCPTLIPLGLNRPLKIQYTFSFPDKRIRDGQNFLKAPLDFLVNQGVLSDDNWNIVTSETWKHTGIDKQNPRIEIEIIVL